MLATLLRDVSAPHWWEHRWRTGHTVAGVAIGVAAVVAMADVSASVIESFRSMMTTVSGDAELEIAGVGGPIDEELTVRVAEVPDVVAAAGLVESFVSLADQPGASLYLLGIDFLGSPVWERQFPRASVHLDDELEFLSQPDSILLAAGFLARHGWTVGDQIVVAGSAGPARLRIRGTLDDVPATRLFGGALGVMDLPAAQRLLGMDRTVHRVLVDAADHGVGSVQAAIAATLGDHLEVAPVESRGLQAERLLFSLRVMLASMSTTAIIVGFLIVFHTVAVSVRQRRRTFALLHVSGVSPDRLRALCLVEVLLLAAVGIALGLWAGRALGRASVDVVGAGAGDIWMRIGDTAVVPSTSGAVLASAGTLAATLLAAWLAIRATFRQTTVEALRPGSVPPPRAPAGLATPALAVTLIAGAWLAAAAPSGLSFGALVALIVAFACAVYAGGAVLAPWLVAAAGAVLGRIRRFVPWFPVQMALDNVARDPQRAGATVATILVAVAIAANVSVTVTSFNTAVLDWIEQHFAADLYVGAGGRMRLGGDDVMPAAVADAVRGVPGVTAVEPFRRRRIAIEGVPAFLHGIAVDERLARGGLAMVDGDLAAAAAALRAGTGVLMSDNLASRLGRRRGDVVSLATPHGVRRYRIEGLYTDYVATLDIGSVAVDYPQLERVWGDRQANLLRVWLEPGRRGDDVRRSVLARLEPMGGFFAVTTGEFLAGVRDLLGGFFQATWALQLVAALVGVIGIVNAQLATVLDRRAELRTLSTIGVPRADLTSSMLVECGLLGALGGVAGAVLGSMIGAEMVTVGIRQTTGLRLPVAVAVAPLAAGVVAAAALSAMAGWVPARAAARAAAQQLPTE